MTRELQQAMARYEEAHFQYRKALLASMNHESDGAAIRLAIHAFQDARAELRRLEQPPPVLPPSPAKARAVSPAMAPQPAWWAPPAPAAPASRPSRGFFLKLLKAS